MRCHIPVSATLFAGSESHRESMDQLNNYSVPQRPAPQKQSTTSRTVTSGDSGCEGLRSTLQESLIEGAMPFRVLPIRKLWLDIIVRSPAPEFECNCILHGPLGPVQQPAPVKLRIVEVKPRCPRFRSGQGRTPMGRPTGEFRHLEPLPCAKHRRHGRSRLARPVGKLLELPVVFVHAAGNELIELGALGPARVCIRVEVYIQAIELKRHVKPTQVTMNRRCETQLREPPPQQFEGFVDFVRQEGSCRR